MKLLPSLYLLGLAAGLPLQPEAQQPLHIEIPSVHTSAILARRLLNLTGQGTLSTVFRPGSALSALPIGLPDYQAACDPADPSDPTLLALPIATSFRNGLAAGANVSLSVEWAPVGGASRRWSAAMPRVALMGYLSAIPEAELRDGAVERCFLDAHPDARHWLPGNRVHTSLWVRLVVREVFWVGGFGDRAFIGWIPVAEWKGVTGEEIEGVRLPGEEGGGEGGNEGGLW
ncbi:MAG: hypothetical protein M1839_008772 [Geoglossum umbratile]|nr:MAG: hypothetical protein M1839_008772 [Geoglossum umbratile]